MTQNCGSNQLTTGLVGDPYSERELIPEGQDPRVGCPRDLEDVYLERRMMDNESFLF